MITNLIILILLKEIYSDSYYLNKNYNLTIEKGESITFLVPEDYRYTNILVYCSLDDTMEISYYTSSVIKTKMYIITPRKFNEERTYQIYLKAKNKPYNFQSVFISQELQVQYSDGYFDFEFSTSYQYLTGALVFVDARNYNKDEMILFYRHIAGNDIQFLYFPLTNDTDFKSLCHSYNYKKNAKTGNLFFPGDDYFILKFIGSTFDIKVQYINVNDEYHDYHETQPLISNKQLIRHATITNEYKYKIDYILGSNENCTVDVKQKSNNNLLGKLSENNHRLIVQVQDLNLISNNCNAVVTIVSNKNNYNIYNIEDESFTQDYLYDNGFSLFRFPKNGTNLRAFRFYIKNGYKLVSYYPCNLYNAGIILVHDIFIETPVYQNTIYKDGDKVILDVFNPYYFENSFNKFKEDEYFMAVYCDCSYVSYSILKPQYSLFVYKLNLKETKYKVNNKMHEVSKSFEPFTNFFQIDPPENENSILTFSVSSCTNYYFRFFILSDYNKIIYENYYNFNNYIFVNCENYTGKEALYIDFENINQEASVYYEYLPYNKTYYYQPSGLPQQFNITNGLDGKIKISFYPALYNEEVKYQIYVVKSDDSFLSLCNFYNIKDENKEIIDIGTYNINNNSIESNQTINKEIEVYFSPNQTLKIGLFYKAVYNYKVQDLFYPISFVYEPKSKNEDGSSNLLLYFVIGIGIVLVLIIVFAICLTMKKMKKTNQIEHNEFKGELLEK